MAEKAAKGGIEKLEMQVFKYHIRPGDRLRCFRPRRKAEEPPKLMVMTVLKKYPFIVTLEFGGMNGKMLKTSMTWQEAIKLNRMRPEQLMKAVKKMQEDLGLPYNIDPVREAIRAGREARNKQILKMRKDGKTYTDIAKVMGISNTTVRSICIKGMKK